MRDESSSDVVFKKNGESYSYTLAESGGKKIWQVSDVSLLPPSMITGEASYSSYSPQRRISTIQEDWRGGLQDLMYDSATKYFRAINTDARFKGKVTLSGKETDTDVSSNLYRKISNSHFEDWDDVNTPTGWTTGGTVAQASGTGEIYDGDWAVKMQNDGEDDGSIYQDLAFTATNQSQIFTISARCKVTADTGTAKIGIEDKDGNTTWSDDIDDTSFALITKVVTLAADATWLRVKAYTDLTGENYLYVDDIKVSTDSGTVAACKAMAEFESASYYAYGDLLFKHDSDGLGVIMEFPEVITALCVYQYPSDANDTDEHLIIGQGHDKHWWYTADAVTFTQNDEVTGATPIGGKYLANIGDGVMLLADSKNTIRSVKSPLNHDGADYTPSSQYVVGGDYYEITGLVDHPDTWFVRKEDQVYYLSGSSVIPLIEGLGIEKNKDIDYPIYFWLDKLYIPSGENHLYEYDITDGTTTDISPVKFAVSDTRYDGKITALASDGLDYLYITVETDARCIVLAGRWETIDDETDWRWHPVWDGTKSAEEISAMIVSNATGNKRLYLGDYQVSDLTSPTGHTDSESAWAFEAHAYDDNVASWATASGILAHTWSDYCEFTIAAGDYSSVSYYYRQDTAGCEDSKIDVDAYYDSNGGAAWHDVVEEDPSGRGWHACALGATYSLTKMRVRFYNGCSVTRAHRIWEVAFGGVAAYYLKDIVIPLSNADPTSEARYEFETPGEFITPWYRTSFSSLDKYFQEIQVTSKCRTDGEIAVYYQLKGAGDPDTATNWKLLGRVTPNDVISGSYPDECLNAFPIKKASERIRFKFRLSTTDAEYSPILYGDGGGIQLISRIAGKVKQIDMTLMVGDNITNSSSAIPNRNVSQQIEDLEMLANSTDPITFTGLDGVERTVLFRTPGYKERPFLIGKNQEEWRIECTLLEAE